MFKNKFLKWTSILIIVFTLGYLTEDMIMTNILGYYHCSQDPNPKTFIKKTVEYPESIYWEDNVYPGFNEADRKLMIMNYLDGKHLKAMALNGDDGKVYLYTAKEGDFDSFEFDKEKYKDQYQQYADLIMQKQQSYRDELFQLSNMALLAKVDELAEKAKKYNYSIPFSKDPEERKQLIKENKALLAQKRKTRDVYVQKVMDTGLVFDTNTDTPLMNYTVRFDPVNLGELSTKYLYSDKVTITDNRTQEVIAYNQRIMHFFYKLFPDIALGNRLYYPHPVCGGEKFIPYWAFGYLEKDEDGKNKLTSRAYNLGIHEHSFNKKLFNK